MHVVHAPFEVSLPVFMADVQFRLCFITLWFWAFDFACCTSEGAHATEHSFCMDARFLRNWGGTECMRGTDVKWKEFFCLCGLP